MRRETGRALRASAASTGDPVAWPPQRSFRKPNCSSATAAASVTTTRLTPRTRRAETAMSRPDDRGRGGADQERDRELRPDPADVGRQVRHREAGDAGERELHDGDLADEADDDDEREADDDAEQRVDAWPGGSRTGTRSARRRPRPRRSRSTAAAAPGRGTAGSRFSTSSPRPGRLAPRRKSARTMTRKTKSSGSPRIGAPPSSVGNQLCVDQ